ncbi:winged helix-turn-helix domain-containing protein [Streptomyces sp. NBC_00237]|uniref:ArsR/SmtB family transcription factor n=1 Tax=Streptomyces sp. NBC_00237 TaxID=2975687 RepID=UPI00224FE6A3|nr:helix-turn-helix domain-containing protein [Streptomyces sp. NBC_00237]MCX5201333.1 winged helix-turn-helix domain-containing protein [Streptomyces sp. NBC_00237]
MLRIHFTGEDLARVRLAARPDALWETVLSLHRLRDRRGGRVYGEWRDRARAGWAASGRQRRLLRSVVPTRGYFPDFLTPEEGAAGWEEGLEAVRGTPEERVRAELAVLEGEEPTAGGEAAPLGGEVELGGLVDALVGYHRAAVAPVWPHVHARVEADRAARGRALLDGGADALLASLPPVLRWRSPVLEADYPVERDVWLEGRGLRLQPSFFCQGAPVMLYDPGLPPVLVYPVAHAPAGVRRGEGPSLGRLVGHTRSAVLRAIDHGCTTSELARRAGVSMASASQHAGVLREAGLVVTLRHGSAVLHSLTPLGVALLRGGAVYP